MATSTTSEQPGPLTLRDLHELEIGALHAATPAVRRGLDELGILTIRDLLTFYPRRHHDRTQRSDIASLTLGEEVTVVAEVVRVEVRQPRAQRGGKRPRSRVEVTIGDGQGYLRCTFFGQPWRAGQLDVGLEVAVFGKVDVFNGVRQMTNPVIDVLGASSDAAENTGVIVPVYPTSSKADISTRQFRTLIGEALRRCRARGFADPLDGELRGELGLVDRWDAYVGIHRPTSMAEVNAAKRRLIFDEFLRMQLGMVARKRAMEAEQRGIEHQSSGTLVQQFHDRLPYELTGDQQRANAEIRADLGASGPMHRLLQGDVGAGKTLVALTMLLHVVDGGHQGAVLAPTEVLAEQHHLSFRALLDGLVVDRSAGLFSQRPLEVALLTGSTTSAERRAKLAGLRDGSVDIVVGTHALLEPAVEFAALGGVVIDEQHRFGVEQRAALRAKTADGTVPDVLVMTATPIPRTAAMLIYGDLDRSELREMPPGRMPITTEQVGHDPMARERAYARLRSEVAAGRQAYLVCPLVEGSAKIEAKAVTEEFERLAREDLAGLRLELLHGQMPSAAKEAAMDRFRSGAADVLVATTVIEVGVDVPNATVMIIEDADRFGLAQLHQLRGRVGRGGGESWCYLCAEPATPDGQARITAMVETTDGFELAERDLAIRGAGELFGDRQSGMSDLKLARIPRDEVSVVLARGVAERILDHDPRLAASPDLAHEVEDLLGEEQLEFLFKN